jgi:hypothetical protein
VLFLVTQGMEIHFKSKFYENWKTKLTVWRFHHMIVFFTLPPTLCRQLIIVFEYSLERNVERTLKAFHTLLVGFNWKYFPTENVYSVSVKWCLIFLTKNLLKIVFYSVKEIFLQECELMDEKCSWIFFQEKLYSLAGTLFHIIHTHTLIFSSISIKFT